VKGFDVIHAHDLGASFIAGRGGRPALIMTSHSPRADLDYLRCYYSWREGGSLREGLRARGESYLIRSIAYLAFRRCDKAIAVSRYVSDRIRRIYGVPAGRIRVIYNGVNAGDFETHRLRYREDERCLGGHVVLMLKPYDPRKGLHHLIRALKLVKRECPDLTLVAAGPRPVGRYGEYIAALMALCDIKEKILFTGRLSFDELLSYYQCAEVVAIPSLQEAFSITALEAAASSRPVVGFNIPGLSEAVVNGETGLLVPRGDENALAAMVIRLLQDERLRARLGSNGRERARGFDWSIITDQVERVYREVSDRE